MVNLYSICLMIALEEDSSLFSADQLGGYAVTALFTVINVFITYLIIKKLLFKPIIGIMKNRQDQINNSLEEAEKAAQEAKKHEEDSKKAIEDARIEASEIIENSRENAEKQAEIIKEKANDDASGILSRAESDSKRMKKVALEEMKDQISDLAVVISGKVIGDVVSESKLKELSDKYTDEVLENEVNKIG